MPLSSVVGASSILKPGVCTSSTRPAAPFEGQTIYETDTDTMRVWNGSAWRLFAEVGSSVNGNVVQVVSTTKLDSFSTTSSTFVDVTGVSVSITPSSTTSKILITVDGVVGNSNSSYLSPINLVRDSTNIAQSTGSVNNATLTIYTNNGNNNSGFGISFLDSPSTTSSTTYKLQMRANSGGTAVIGRIAPNTDWGSVTTITAMEISA